VEIAPQLDSSAGPLYDPAFRYMADKITLVLINQLKTSDPTSLFVSTVHPDIREKLTF
jgi:hypothetical protein